MDPQLFLGALILYSLIGFGIWLYLLCGSEVTQDIDSMFGWVFGWFFILIACAISFVGEKTGDLIHRARSSHRP